MRNVDSLPTARQNTDHFHTSYIRKLLKIKGQDRFPDTEVLERAEMQSVHTILKLAQLRRAGHATRMSEERLPKKIITAMSKKKFYKTTIR